MPITPTKGLLLRVRVWRQRFSLDEQLAQGASPADSPELARRTTELLTERMRRKLAKWLERLLDEAQERPPGRMTAALPLDREAIRIARPELLSLVRDLGSVNEPVEVRGVARAHLLLSDGASPLYAWQHGDDERPMDATLEWKARHARTSLALG